MHYTKKILATLLLVLLIVPPTLLASPEPAHAIFGIGDIVWDPTNWIQQSITAINEVLTQVNTYAVRIKTWILDPLAFVLSGDLLKAITAGVIDFINGVTNGTGRPSYVQDLNGHLLLASDISALAFFAEFGGSNSPFASVIVSSLRGAYLIETSGNGFWFRNQSTLPQFSQNPLAFISGDFRQGGWAAWLALTTRPQDNPYLSYYAARAELGTRVSQTTSSVLNELAWGDGFLSWCGDQTASGGATLAGAGTGLPTVTVTPAQTGTVPSSVAVTSALDCKKADGTYGSIRTPGSVIKTTLDQVLGTNLEKSTLLGDASADIDSIFANLSSIMSIIGYGASLLGANGSGGLFGYGQTSASQPVSALNQYRNSNGFLGITSTSVTQGTSVGDTLATRLTKYQNAWQTINTSTNSASGALAQMTAACAAPYDLAATRVTSNTISPILNEYAAALGTITSGQNYLAQNPLNTASPSYGSDLVAQQTIAPTSADVVYAERQASAQGSAIASPTGSFNISGATYVDETSLIRSTATTYASTCNSTTTVPIL